KAEELLKIAADDGIPFAMLELGHLVRNNSEKFKWYKKAADAGELWGYCNLGVCYQNNIGVEKNYSKALECYMKAVDGGIFDMLSEVGYIYYIGGYGVTKDFTKAYKYFIDATEHKNCPSWVYTYIGNMYSDGNGVTRNYAKAHEWYYKAINRDDAVAMSNLALLYAEGNGVKKDISKAREWLVKSREAGNKEAEEILIQLDESMKKEDNDGCSAVIGGFIVGALAFVFPPIGIPLAIIYFLKGK
ncbi:MAG: sel1 repeat family protein, partial [Selenomonadaceae bacterium]|nr:sel1 repeat family protein [Selenomonadaceae bacterium]